MNLQELFAPLRPQVNLGPVEWCEANINLARDPTSAALGPPCIRQVTPYLVEPLTWWASHGRRKGTFVAPEQTAKSTWWKFGLLWTLSCRRTLALVVYESDEKAERENGESLEPLMRGVPALESFLKLPKCKRKDRYIFGENIVTFGGAGKEITSSRQNVVIGDEVDSWVARSEKADNVANLDKRTRTFPDAKRALCCSPKTSDGIIWREFMLGSQGYWHFRCLDCGELSMRACDIGGHLVGDEWKGGLQFDIAEIEGEKTAVPDSIRLICPRCGAKFEERERGELSGKGAYVHRFPDRQSFHSSWQVGGLASPFPGLAWPEIANAQLRAGKSGSYSERRLFFNSYRGLPVTADDLRDGQGNDRMAADALLKVHARELPEESAALDRIFAADTQAKDFYWIVRGFDNRGNSYLLANGIAETKEELLEAWRTRYHGGLPMVGVVDTGGHRARELYPVIAGTPGLFGYKGNSRISTRFTAAKGSSKLIIANPKVYQADLLYALHSQLDPAKVPFWALPFELDADYQKQILNVRPVESRRYGKAFENWEGTGNDHYFDCEKMALLGWELALMSKKLNRARLAPQRVPPPEGRR